MRRTTLTLAVVLLCGCGAATGTGGSNAQVTSSPAVLACTPSGAASPSWTSTYPTTAPAIASAVADGDTLTFTFIAGTPQFEVVPVDSAQFAADPSGRPVSLAGTSGVGIVFRGFRGDMSNYSGAARLKSTGPLLLEAAATGDFEGVVNFGAGVSAPACANVSAGPSTLTFHFIEPVQGS
ncbi:MAG: hypothetical protein E6I73_07825 [Chloroflexi bacterium]|nr:MAG: hypothetical protein E6I73_07825 [Chloroflexota bacterium]